MNINLKGRIEKEKRLIGHIKESSIKGGTNNYEELYNKPSINEIELNGNLTAEALFLQRQMKRISNSEIEKIFN